MPDRREPGVVLVPGFTQTAASWDGVRAHLVARARPIDVPERESFPATAAAIGDAGGYAIYVGYSMGGRLCLQLALDAPHLVEHVVLVSASPGLAEATEREERRASDEALARGIERDGVDAFLARWLAQPLFASVPGTAPGLAERSSLPAAYLAHCLQVLGTGVMPSAWDRLAGLSVPCTLVTGRADTKFTTIAREMLVRLPVGTTHVEISAGHAIPLEAPAELARVIDRVSGSE